MEEIENAILQIANETTAGENTKTRVANVLTLVKNKLSLANSYSETETLTGFNWIDGLPIYRKTKVFSGSELPESIFLPLSIVFININTIVDAKVFFNDENYNGISYFNSSVFNSIGIHTNVIYLLNRDNETMKWSDFQSVTVTFEYTKNQGN